MARIQYGPLMAGRAGADFRTTGRYLLVKLATSLSADGQPAFALNSVAGEDVAGVLMDKPNTGETATVQTYDTVKVTAGAAISNVGVALMADGNGKVITATGSGKFVLGHNLEPAGADGDIISVRLSQAHYPLA